MSINHEAAVLLTLAYSDQFSFPLTNTELAQRLIRLPLTKKEATQAILILEQKKIVQAQADFWRIVNGKADQKIRSQRENISQSRWQETQQLLEIIGWVPWIKGMAITGSLAVNNSLTHSDTDLMIVVEKNRLWLSRILVSLSAYFVGKRRTWRGNEADSWCFNLWLEEDSLGLARHKRSLYTAYEVCQAKWILDKSKVEKKFIQANFWVEKYLPNYFSAALNRVFISSKSKNLFGFWGLKYIFKKMMDLLNLFVFIIQYGYMYSHMSRETVGLSQAYFHPRSTKGQVYQRWYNSLIHLWKN